jgi:hypothetical protein
MDPSTRLGLVALLLTHTLSLAVWIGAMLFNLVVNFPALRSRARTVAELTSAMGAQARRAAPWLYLLMALVVLSGLGLQFGLAGTPGTATAGMARTLGTSGAAGPAAAAPSATIAGWILLMKWVALGAMALLHAWGSWSLWPRIYFALDRERPALFMRYQLAMAASATLGIAAIAISFWARWG